MKISMTLRRPTLRALHVALASAALAVAGCSSLGAPRTKGDSDVFGPMRITEHRGNDDLLTAGDFDFDLDRYGRHDGWV